MKEYFLCSSCHQIEPKEIWITPYLIKQCVHCSGSRFEKWPSRDIQDLFDHAINYDKKDDHYSLVTSVFISTALELLLENLLNSIIYLEGDYDEIGYLADLLIDSYQGKFRRLSLFKRINGRSFSAEAKDTGNKNFIKHWDEFSQKRNKLVHGIDYQNKEITHSQVVTIIDEALDVFYKLHNQFNVESFSYNCYVNEGNHDVEKPSEEDIQKLSKWLNKKIDTN